MSGTSLDAVDAAMILTDGIDVLDFGPVAERKYTPSERAVLKKAVDAARSWNWTGPQPDRAFSDANQVLTATHVDAFREMIRVRNEHSPELAGVHGQTVLHRAPKADAKGNTLQILDAKQLRDTIGLPLAYDFRTKDVDEGGQGAPLAPAYHAALLRRLGTDRSQAVLNLGGVANITLHQTDGTIVAFDTGPANGPIDEWVELHGLGTYDVDGAIASSGRVNELSIEQWMDNPWFDNHGPKSLDRFDFSADLARGMSVEDGAATLTAFSAECVAHAVRNAAEVPEQLIVCGGGRRNPALMEELRRRVPCQVLSAEDVGWLGDSIEAQAFAYLAVRTLRGLPISWPGTTRVPVAMTGGKLID